MPRDISGNYTLPVGNPVVDGTIIDVNWANPTMSDIATQLNNVITRDGVLGALNPIKFASGSAAAPSITFTADPALGLYRIGSNILGIAVSGVEAVRVAAGGVTLASSLVLSSGQIATPLGSVGAPSYSIAGDLNTGVWSPAADTVAMSVGGVESTRWNATGFGVGMTPASRFQVQVANEAGGGSNQGVGIIAPANARQFNLGIDTTNGYVWAQSWIPGSGSGALALNPIGGNVSVGGASGSGALSVRGSNVIASFYTSTARGSGGAYIQIYDPTGAKGYFGYGGASDTLQIANLLNGDVQFYANNILRGSFLSAGGLTISTPTSGSALVVNGVAGASRAAIINGSYTELQLAGVAYGYLGDRTGVVGSGSGTALRSEGLLTLSAGGVSGRLELTTDGRLYGNALHNNAGAVTGTTNQYIASGTWTPTWTAVSNVTGTPTSTVGQWVRTGNVVKFAVQGTINVTAVGGWVARFTLPVASNFATATNANGVGSGPTNAFIYNLQLLSDSVNDAIRVDGYSGANGSTTYLFVGQYEVL